MTALVVQPGRSLARPARRVVVPPSRLPRSVYLRRRLAVGALGLVAILGSFGVAESVLGATGERVAASEAVEVAAPGAVIARPGDTLWELARQYRGEVPLDRYLERLVQANGGPSIRAGQTIVLP